MVKILSTLANFLVEALKVGIAADCEAARRILAVTPPIPSVGN